MKTCEICTKSMYSAIDFNSHMLFEHNIVTNEDGGVDESVYQELRGKYERAMAKLHLYSVISNKLGKEYHESNRDRDIWKQYLEADKKWQKQVYRVNSIVKDMESYGFTEEMFQ